MIVKNDLFDYKNRYIFQDTEFFKFSLDSILLAEFIRPLKDNIKILDMCAGNMAIPLILSTYTNNKIVGFEIQKEVYNLANESILYNKLESQLKIINDDIKNISKYFNRESFDLMLCNPPYFKVNCAHINKQQELSYARHELAVTLEDLFIIASKFLKNKGKFYMVHRADRLDEIINLGYKYNVYVKCVQLISTKKGENPRIVLIKCSKNSKPNIKIYHEKCIEGVKTYQNYFKEDV